jgi:acyl dehydratase
MIDPDFIANFSTSGEQRYDQRDTILYALGVGAGVADADRKYVYEAELQPVPSMAAILAREPFWIDDPRTGITVSKMLHGEQTLAIHAQVPVEGEVRSTLHVVGLYDKGPEKGAVLDMRRELYDAASGSHLATVGIRSVLRGDGGFGGQPDGLPQPHPARAGEPDIVVAMPTVSQQALIYRLSGDYNPIHIDPEVGRRAGFDGVIFHGLGTYGVVARAIVQGALDNEPSRLRQFDVRFSSPVYPGETIVVEIWKEGAGQLSFRARVKERDRIVINNGLARHV